MSALGTFAERLVVPVQSAVRISSDVPSSLLHWWAVACSQASALRRVRQRSEVATSWLCSAVVGWV